LLRLNGKCHQCGCHGKKHFGVKLVEIRGRRMVALVGRFFDCDEGRAQPQLDVFVADESQISIVSALLQAVP